MSEPRPPIHPADDDWPETRDYHRETAEEVERLREALRVAKEAIVGSNIETAMRALADIDAALKGESHD